MRQEPCTQRAFFGGLKVEFSRGCDWDGVMDGKFPGTLSSRPTGAARSLETALSTRFGDCDKETKPRPPRVPWNWIGEAQQSGIPAPRRSAAPGCRGEAPPESSAGAAVSQSTLLSTQSCALARHARRHRGSGHRHGSGRCRRGRPVLVGREARPGRHRGLALHGPRQARSPLLQPLRDDVGATSEEMARKTPKCPACSGAKKPAKVKKLTPKERRAAKAEAFAAKVLERSCGALVVDVGSYSTSTAKVAVTCSACGHRWSTRSDNLLSRHWCPKCGAGR